MAEQDQRRRCGCGHGSPQDAGDLAEAEFAFEDAVVETLFRSEMHGRAFRECTERRSRTTYRPTVAPEGSTHVDTAFTGTTSSFSRTATEKVAVVAVVRQRVFAEAPWPDATAPLASIPVIDAAPLLEWTVMCITAQAGDGVRISLRQPGVHPHLHRPFTGHASAVVWHGVLRQQDQGSRVPRPQKDRPRTGPLTRYIDAATRFTLRAGGGRDLPRRGRRGRGCARPIGRSRGRR